MLEEQQVQVQANSELVVTAPVTRVVATTMAKPGRRSSPSDTDIITDGTLRFVFPRRRVCVKLTVKGDICVS